MALDLDYFQKQLLEEKARLEAELKTVATRNPDAPQDWNVSYPNLNVQTSAVDEVADQEEEYENRAPLEGGLEVRLQEVNEALERIEHGKYGMCVEDGESIDEERLRANPAARTCMKHAEKVK